MNPRILHPNFALRSERLAGLYAFRRVCVHVGMSVFMWARSKAVGPVTALLRQTKAWVHFEARSASRRDTHRL